MDQIVILSSWIRFEINLQVIQLLVYLISAIRGVLMVGFCLIRASCEAWTVILENSHRKQRLHKLLYLTHTDASIYRSH